MSDLPHFLSGTALRQAKAQAQRLRPSVRLGKAGADSAFHQALDTELNLRSLAKIKFEHHQASKKTLAPEIARQAQAQIILFVGHTLTLYRPPPA
ncbi:MAG: YhbY family RNA-binding protein [Verrucomicrobiia bacterium]